MSIANRPNILLITTDQQRFDTFGAAKPPFLNTPHLDLLAADGVTFTSAYADCPICVASRMAIMTGNYCLTHGMGTNARTCQYMDEAGTLPTRLRALGYQTCVIGKPHFDPQYKRHGFDEIIPLADYYRQMARSGSALQPRRHGLGENELYATCATVPEAQTLTSWITEQAVEYLAHRKDPTKPWFLWVAYAKPHPPLDPPEPYYSMYRQSAIPKPWIGAWSEQPETLPHPARIKQLGHLVLDQSEEQIRSARAAYYGLITHIDYNLGRILAGVQDTGTHEKYSFHDDTLIVFASDHGDMMGDHHMLAKGELYEGSAHVPLIVRMPQSWEDRRRGARCPALSTLADILPTCVAAAGGSAGDADGRDLVAVARGQTPARELLFAAQGFRKDNDAALSWIGVTDGRWKYSWYFQDGRQQLFDLENDPHELHDLALEDRHAGKMAELRVRIETILRERYAGRFLKEGRLHFDERFHRPTDVELRGTGFPGFMRDDHASDALH